MNLDGAFTEMQSAGDAFVRETDQPENVRLSGREVKGSGDRCRLDHYRGKFSGRFWVGHGAPPMKCLVSPGSVEAAATDQGQSVNESTWFWAVHEGEPPSDSKNAPEWIETQLDLGRASYAEDDAVFEVLTTRPTAAVFDHIGARRASSMSWDDNFMRAAQRTMP
jgi:hypothetical protein